MRFAAVVVERRFEGATIYCHAPSIRLRVTVTGNQTCPATACEAARFAIDSSGGMSPTSPNPICAMTPALLIGELAVLLQRAAGFACSRFAQSATHGDTAWIDYEAPDSKTGVAAGFAAGVMISTLLDTNFDPKHSQELTETAANFRTDFSRGGKRALFDYVWTAAARGLPWRRISADADIYEIGQGCKRRLYLRHSTMRTGQVSCHAAMRKSISARMLREAGLPVPPHHVVTTEPEAINAAQTLGFPVVIKPEATDFGTAVTTDLRTEPDVRTAFHLARKHGRVLVEKHLDGLNCRLLVVNGRMVSAVQQTPAHVIGDGRSTVDKLVERTNAGRSEGLSESWKKIAHDAATDTLLQYQGFIRQSVPPVGAIVWLRQQSNLSTGGTMTNTTGLVHPDTARMAERAASIMGLDVAGIDFITTDISQPPSDGGICEINPNPGFIMGEPPDRLETLFIEADFPTEATGRIPVIVVLCAEPHPLLAKGITAEAARRWPELGLSEDASVASAGRSIATARLGAADGTRALLSDPAVTALLQLTTPEEVIANGLGCNRIDLGILAPLSADRLGDGAAATAADLIAALAQTVVLAENDPRRAGVTVVAGKHTRLVAMVDDQSFLEACRAVIREIAGSAHKG